MIIYFADRRMNILGQASTGLPEGIFIKNDEKTEEVEAGVSTLEFDLYFTDETRENAKKWSDTGNYILRENGDEQEFYTIIESEMSVYDKRINIYAEDAGMDLLNETVGAYTADKAYPAKYYIEKYSYDSGFELGLNEISDLNRKLSWDGETTASARLLSVATQFDAELSYTFEINELKIKHKYINLHKKRGKDNGVELRINREVSNITEKKSVADLATGLSVTGGTPEGSEQPITLNGYKYDDGDFYVSGTCVFSRNALSKWSRYLSESGNDVGHIMQVYTYDTTSQSELCNRAVSKLKKICDVSVTYEVELAYLPVGVKIGDMVDIVDDAGELYLSARIMKLVVSEANKTYTATLGNYTLKTDGISEKVLELAAQFEQLAKNRTLYTWVVFADDENGSNISIDASEKEYMGIAYNQVTKKADLSAPEIYTWVKITGGQGIPGPAGKDGNDGRTSFFHVKYSDVPEPTTSQMNEKGGKYIGTYVDFDVNNSSDPKKYTWRQFEGDTGKQGEKGIPGKNGENGLTSYLHIAYATSADGKTGFSVNEPAGKTYIGQYTDFMEEDSTDPNKYAWSRTEGKKGETGNGIESTDITYQAGASGTTPPTETWTTEKPKTSADKPFFWTRMVFTYTDGTTSTAYSVGCTAEGIVEILKDQIDQKIETWYQDIDPAINWTGTEEQNLCDSNGDPILDVDNNPIVITVEIEKMQHEGDLWKNSKTSEEYIYKHGNWQLMPIPDAVFDEIDGKSSIYVSQPIPPYNVGDAWFSGTDILTCVVERDSGEFVASDWQKKNNYTDDATVTDFIENIYDPKIADIQNQIDGKLDTYYYDYEPKNTNPPASSWTTAVEKQKHNGDLFFWKSKGYTYRYLKVNTDYQWVRVKDADIEKAMTAASNAQDTADGKRRVFVTKPVPPYDIGDLWSQGTKGELMCCIIAKKSGGYEEKDWEKATKYTDNSELKKFNEELDQSELFNRLTNNGLEQGIFLKDKKIYINFSYAEGGTLKLGGVDNADGTLVVRDASGNEVGSWTKEGLDVKKGVISGSKIVLNNTLTDPAYISGMYEGTETLRINASGIKLGSNSVFNPKESQFVFDMHPFMFPGITLKDKEKGAGYGCSWTPKTFGILYSEAIEGFSDALMVSANDNKILMRVDSEDNAGTRICVSGDGGLLKNNSIMSATGIYTTGTKNRIVNTENYASRLQYCYEMPSPMFGDIGEGYTDDTGVCIVAVDDIFRETVTNGAKYHVFLQKEGPGDIWIENKTDSYFTVQGTKNMKFSWEIKAKQKEYEFERLECYKESENDEEYINYEDVGYYTYAKYVNDLELGGEEV